MMQVTQVKHPLVQHKLTLLRDKSTPTVLFRQIMRETSQLLAFAVTDDLQVEMRAIDTPMQAMQSPFLAGQPPAVVSILRAGNGFLDGVLDVLPTAAVGFVGLYRDEETLQPVQYYFKMPPALEWRQVIVVDPMLATGNSSAAAIDLIKQAGAKRIKLLTLLSAPEGVKIMQDQHPDVQIFTACIDECLNEKGYILPGLGDAGDRMFGT